MIMLHTLLLNSTYECISFITERAAFRLIAKDKVEVLSTWDEMVRWGAGQMHHPAVIRLKHNVRFLPRRLKFNKKSIFRRDQYICQYCGKAVITSRCSLDMKATVDHVIPKDKGGKNCWNNCVTACWPCNSKKGNRTMEEAGMTLIKHPSVAKFTIYSDYVIMNTKHDDWKLYIQP